MASNDLSARIRSDVEAGRPRDEIIATLLERGLSQASAERFVDRALASHASGAPPAERPRTPRAADDDEEDSTGRSSLVGGAFWLSFGCAATGVTYLFAKPGGKYMLAYGAMIGGLLAFGRGLKRFLDAGPAPFPWKAVTIAALVPVVGIGGLAGFVRGRAALQRAEREQAAEAVQETRIAEARAAEERAVAEAAQSAAAEAEQQRTQAQAERVNQVVERLRSAPDDMAVCNAAKEVGRVAAREAIPDLRARLRGGSVRAQSCAAAALVGFGETDGPLAFYVTAAQSPDGDIRKLGLLGFGGVGSTAFASAEPYLAAALRDPDRAQHYWALQALARMGPEAAPLLRTMVDDPDPMAKSMATEALAKLGQQP